MTVAELIEILNQVENKGQVVAVKYAVTNRDGEICGYESTEVMTAKSRKRTYVDDTFVEEAFLIEDI